MTDGLSTLYQDLPGGSYDCGSYDCVDRIVLNAYSRMGHDPGGFRVWWRALTGSDETLENAYLMLLAGPVQPSHSRLCQSPRHSRDRLSGRAAQARPRRRISGPDQGHPGLVSGPGRPGAGAGVGCRRKAPHRAKEADAPSLRWGRLYVNHYSFHILDPDWGHLTIKISGHPPFPAQVILNGHEYVACQARKAGITFTKEGNCFTTISDAAGLAKIADTLSEPRAIGRLSQVCERWIYHCVCFALDFDEQKRSGSRYQSKPGLRGGRAHGPGVSGPH